MALNNEAELLLYGNLGEQEGWDDITSKEFAKQLAELKEKKRINVRINSYGGSVFTGLAIYSMLARMKARVTTIIDGIAASAASVVAMAGNKVVMPRNSILMIHNPYMMAMGDQNEMLKVAEDLEKIREAIIPAYTLKTGLDKEKIIEMLNKETWLTAEQALQLGFADEIEENRQIEAKILNNKLVINGFEFELNELKHKPVFNLIQNKERKMDLNKEILKGEYTHIYNEIFNEGIQTERTRIMELGQIEDSPINEVKNLINEAKKDGRSAKDIAMEIIKLQNIEALKQKPLNNLKIDTAKLDTLANTEPINNDKESKKTFLSSISASMQNTVKKLRENK